MISKGNIPVVEMFGVPVANLSMEQTIETVQESIFRKEELQHVVVNAGKIVAMQRDEALKKSVLDADLINADGQAVVWAANFLGQPLPERVAGIDLMFKLIEMAYREGLKCYFFGAKEEVVKKVVEIFSSQYSQEVIAGYRNGYFSNEEEKQIASDIGNSGAQLLFVAITSPKKELFVKKYKSIMKVPFIMGVGGSFDVVAGKTRRAPVWMQNFGLEWFYRFVQEPKRMWRRYLVGNTKFIWLVLKEKSKSIIQT